MVPTIYTLDGAKISMYHVEHNPPHVHVNDSGKEAVINIRDRKVTASTLSAKKLKQVQNWIKQNEQQLLDMWEKRIEEGGIKPI